VVFLKSVSSARVRLVLLWIVLALLMLNRASVAQQPSAQPTGSEPSSPQPSSSRPSSSRQSVPPKHPAKAVKKPAPEPPPAPAPPPPPLTLAQMPALPPQVRYSRGQLTIVAENSTLADILRAVRTQTGAQVEVPPNATERVVAHLGPGPARDVLAALLNGTHFNYVMLGSPAHPDSVDRVILTSKSGGVPEVAPPAAEGNNQFQVDEQGTQGVDISEQPVDDPADNSASETSQPQPNAQRVKTPEELLRELQQQQQQQQQQQAAPGGPPPQGGPN
jgi:hypothetical protein